MVALEEEEMLHPADTSDEVLIAGVFQPIELTASERMSVYVPYLIKDPETGFVQNTTVVDIGGGDTVLLEVLAPLG